MTDHEAHAEFTSIIIGIVEFVEYTHLLTRYSGKVNIVADVFELLTKFTSAAQLTKELGL